VPKLPIVTDREMMNYLVKKGFECIGGKRHAVFSNGVRRTEVPRHGNKELGKGLLKKILEQAGINEEDFKRDWYE
jgi:predicted RNA binding protein YcfA (HicA-like mRNA interferase family)